MSAQTLRWPECDLRVRPPRSPRETLAGLVLLPRTIDKARAIVQGTAGLYKVTPGLSGYLLRELGVEEDAFMALIESGADDDAIADWIVAHSDPAGFVAINAMLTARGIRDQAHFEEVLPRYPILREHPELRNWFEILELDDVWSFDPVNAAAVKAAAPGSD